MPPEYRRRILFFFSFSFFFFLLLLLLFFLFSTECKEPVRCHGMRFVGVPGEKRKREDERGSDRSSLTTELKRSWRKSAKMWRTLLGIGSPGRCFLTVADALEIYVHCCLWNVRCVVSRTSWYLARVKLRRSRTGVDFRENFTEHRYPLHWTFQVTSKQG